ncbi:acetate/propionate family kinase [Pseudomonas sp. PS01302]|uniref:acetate/propionate family kinase n=1 Tax=Pseudomonas sp. PS01302 TaxID=2991438 RepID=UPI0032B5BD6F
MSAPSTERLVLVLNCGSSSIKFAVFDASLDPMPRRPLWNGKVQGIGGDVPDFGETGVAPFRVQLDTETPHRSALQLIRERVSARLNEHSSLSAIAHRIVHGGSKYSAPIRVDAQVLADLKGYVPLAPLHQPFALEAIEVLLQDLPQVPQIACFDTGFHHTLPEVEQVLPLPYEAWQRGLRRYGFHGLSYEYMATALAQRHGQAAQGRTIVAHLGSGASLCAMKGLQSVATTMGFSALDGLMMGTRTGSLDPGAVLYLMEVERLSLGQVGDILYHRSGLLGVSGISSEPRVLAKHESDAGEPGTRARLALELYVRRIVREIGALTAVLGGLDLLVFTAGVGEHSAFVRERVCRGLAFLGVALDEPANLVDAPVISQSDSPVLVGVEPTNEEWIIAGHARQVLRLTQTPRPDPWKNAMYKRLLVPLDGSPTAHLALDHAAALARLSGATVVLLHVIEELKHSNGFERPKVYLDEVRPGFLAAGQALLDQAAGRLRQDGIAVETLLNEAKGERVSELIAKQAETARCDVVVLGTHGRRGMDRLLLGSDAEQVARIAPVPVMLVRHPHPAATGVPLAKCD